MSQVVLALGMLVLLAVQVRSRPERTLSSTDTIHYAELATSSQTIPSPSSSATHNSADTDTYPVTHSSDRLSDASSASILVGGTDVPLVSSSIADLDISLVKDSLSTSDNPPNRTLELKPINSSLELPTAEEPTLDDIDAELLDESLLSNYSYDPSFVPIWEKDPLQFRRFLIQDLKKKILDGLKLTDAPTEILNDNDFSDDVIKILHEEEKEISRSDQKENLVVHAINQNYTCHKSSGSFCRRFEFSVAADLDSIISAHAWFHKTMPSRRLVISAYSSMVDDDESLVVLKEPLNKTKSEPSWITFELPKMLVFENIDDRLLCSVEIEGADIDTEGDKTPFLVITKHTEILDNQKTAIRRDKRSVPSSDNCTCCMENFVVTVEEIGYEKWVHKPRSFNIKMCRGTCVENLSSYTIQYQQTLSLYYKRNPEYPKPECNFWAPRCQPETYLPLRMVYKSNNGTLHDRVMPDMVVDSCKCS